jgi:hypothetical protein
MSDEAREPELKLLRARLAELAQENAALREGEDGWRGAWPREAFANILRQSGLNLSDAQIAGLSTLVEEAVVKWAVGSTRQPEP